MTSMKLSLRKIRVFTLLAASFLSAGLISSCGKEKPVNIGIVMDVSVFTRTLNGFKNRMAEFGYIEGKNVKYIFYDPMEYKDMTVDKQIKNVLSNKPDMMLAFGYQAALKSKEAIKETDKPLIVSVVKSSDLLEITGDPQSPNITGVGITFHADKTLEWLKAVSPELKKVLVPYNPLDSVSADDIAHRLEKVGSEIGIEIIPAEVNSAEEAAARIESSPADVGAVLRIPSSSLDDKNEQLSRAAIKRGVPMAASLQLDKDVLLTFASDLNDMGKQSARLAQQILLGVRPSDLPIETAEVYLTINIGTAGKIGLHIPDKVITQANKIVR
jgi:putative tryptophan/tyrosine transport system substrate-binding protein